RTETHNVSLDNFPARMNFSPKKPINLVAAVET
ncbi:unnamed protein product, partial [Oikopleura dioica]